MNEMERKTLANLGVVDEPAAEDRRDAGQIAESINQIKAEVRQTVLSGAIRIGQELKAAKSKVPYGEWEEWLEVNVDYSVRTAQNLMRLAEEYHRNSLTGMENLNITQAVLLLGLPAGEREAFVQEHDVEQMSTDELNRQIQELKAEKAKMQLTIDELMATESRPGDGWQNEKEALLAEHEAHLQEQRRQLEAAQKEAERLEKKAREQEQEMLKATQEAARARTEKTAEKNKAEALERQKTRLEEELEAERSKPETVREVAPEGMVRELEALRAAQSRGQTEVELRTIYQGMTETFQRLVDKLEEMRETDAGKAGEMGVTFGRALRKMAEIVEG